MKKHTSKDLPAKTQLNDNLHEEPGSSKNILSKNNKIKGPTDTKQKKNLKGPSKIANGKVSIPSSKIPRKY